VSDARDKRGYVYGRHAFVIDEAAPECFHCGSKNLKDKGSFAKCMDCGERITHQGRWVLAADEGKA